MANIDFEKFVTSLLCGDPQCNWTIGTVDIRNALKEQGLEYKDGKIIEIKRDDSKPISVKDLEERLTKVEERFEIIESKLDKLLDRTCIIGSPFKYYADAITKKNLQCCDNTGDLEKEE